MTYPCLIAIPSQLRDDMIKIQGNHFTGVYKRNESVVIFAITRLIPSAQYSKEH